MRTKTRAERTDRTVTAPREAEKAPLLSPGQATLMIETHGWTLLDVCALVEAFAMKLQSSTSMKWSRGRVLVWITKETRRRAARKGSGERGG